MKKYENAFFERNRVLFFWPISLVNPFISRPRSIKKKRSQIDVFSLVLLRPAGRPRVTDFAPKDKFIKKKFLDKKHAARAKTIILLEQLQICISGDGVRL